MTVGIGVISGSAFTISGGGPMAVAPVTIKGALPGDKIINVYALAGPNAPASLIAGDVTANFGSHLVGFGGATEIVCINDGFSGGFPSLSACVIIVSVATTG